jgi:hypothetical protein
LQSREEVVQLGLKNVEHGVRVSPRGRRDGATRGGTTPSPACRPRLNHFGGYRRRLRIRTNAFLPDLTLVKDA